MTTFEPGPSVVLTHGLRDSPRSTAFFASSPAAIITDGLEVLVQDVMAARTTAPLSRVKLSPLGKLTAVGVLVRPVRASTKAFLLSTKAIRSCGRLGPEMEGCTVLRSSSRTDV